MEHTTIVGNLCADPETVKLTSGSTVTKMRVAVNRLIRSASGDSTEVSYYTVEAWNALGTNAAASFSKGDHVIVSGDIRQDRWESQDSDGKVTKRERVKIVAFEMGASVRFGAVQSNREVVPVGASSDFEEEPF